ncbi:MAG: endonuclease/exonuclease/phosphatase family protein [Maribacter sp.]|nr:endonuclease/exonuclease/phosphatase family protein [Maribacter sp.]
MNKNIAILLLLSILSFNLTGQDLKLMSYNIKYDNKRDTVNNWIDRKESLIRLIRHYEPSFIGTQEALHHQVKYIDSCLVDFAFIGVGRDDGRQAGEYTAIHYDTTLYKVLDSNTFWLSESPEKVSVGWDAAMERICTYGLFENLKTKEQFYVFNTHFDHIGEKAREQSANLILQRIKKINDQNLAVVLMGDFNLRPEEKPIQQIRSKMKDGKDITERPFYGPEGTFNGFDQNVALDHRIDYIFITKFKVKFYVHIDDRMDNNKHISDHLPVLIGVEK